MSSQEFIVGKEKKLTDKGRGENIFGEKNSWTFVLAKIADSYSLYVQYSYMSIYLSFYITNHSIFRLIAPGSPGDLKIAIKI